ncbi:unnamed protein product [Albugo candida]|uniref:SET domain-containing protein n=1 Tax=Albugo candida TaxID=65357 RepID=A0A024G446_9STRA|nr:unnamed protein product [Albugo candida]|eukprot:CCI41411.1 unnamed protein product [Albugo candida]
MQRLENVHVHKYYAQLIANKQRASITCGYAGEHKGKAIYAINAFAPGDRIWSEVPFVAMQHEENKHHIQCCAHCFIPLIDASVEWERVRNAAEAFIASSDRKLDSLATFSELEKTIEYVRSVKAKHSDENYEQKYFATRGTAASCEQCAINEIFLLAAKVVAKVVLLYLKHSDLAKARFAVDQFHKLNWWDVVVSEEDVRDSEQTMEEYKASFRDLISQTFECFQAGLEDTLAIVLRVEKDRFPCNKSVEEVCIACEDVLNVDFFAKIVGMFEMNNISMEIDHPLQVLNTDLEDMPALENEAKNRVARTLELACTSTVSNSPSSDQQASANTLHEEEFCLDKKPSPGPFVGVEGTALFSLICTMNHSCLPNCIVVYGHSGQAHIHAIQAIQPMDELCIEYIDTDQPYEERQHELRYITS